MDARAVFDRLTPLFREVFDNDDILLRPDLTAAEVPEWDSLSHIRLVVAVEEAFSVALNASEVASLKNVGEFVEVILRKAGP